MKILLALFLSFSTAMAQASVVTYSFSGVLSSPTRFDPVGANQEPVLWDLVAQGDRFSGRFTFDTSEPQQEFDTPPWGHYSLLGFEFNGSERLNQALTTWSHDWVEVYDGMDWTDSELWITASTYLDSDHVLQARMRMTPSNGIAFSGSRVPDRFDDFALASINLTLYHMDEFVFDQASGSAQVMLEDRVAVPEPATGLLLLAGMAGLCARRRRS